MSVVVIPGATVPNLSDDEFESHLAHVGIRNLSNTEKAAYKPILQSFLAVMRKVDEDPDYTPPSLNSEPATTDRNYTTPNPEENPMNAWSHICNIGNTSLPTKTPGAMQGRSVAIKDNISVAGVPTTIGLPPELFEGGQYPTASVDATVVARLLDAGAFIRGTSTCEGWW
ncbi:hypothetical protein SEPCBS119000_006431 [Sporothrix epigloea]|uniref:Amidase domain-containing protein n=1 Tax=Sporothrix epigloea TaxID=1892477 RepID=A0ABP0E2Y8_9PEZI